MLNTANLPDIVNDPAAGLPIPEEADRQPSPPSFGAVPLEPGSVTAQALFAVWSGQRCVIVDSPPGAGKTTAVSTIVSQLVERSELAVFVACPTRAQVAALANKLAGIIGPEKVRVPTQGITADLDEGITRSKAHQAGFVVVCTVASAAHTQRDADVAIIDEAYQATFADVAAAVGNCDQVLLVGDPGQIGPVVTAPVGPFRQAMFPPNGRAPEVFAKAAVDKVRINMDRTYRLGPETVDVISPLYRFAFDSGRPDRSISGRDEIEVIEIDAADSPDAESVGCAAVDAVESLMVGSLIDADGERPIEQDDVAVVVAHNSAVSVVGAMLRARGLDDVTVGTSDRLQGGEWNAVVAVDPLTGGTNGVGPHTLSLGRLCVMLSRHATHLTWIHDGTWRASLVPEGKDTETRTALAVRESVCER